MISITPRFLPPPYIKDILDNQEPMTRLQAAKKLTDFVGLVKNFQGTDYPFVVHLSWTQSEGFMARFRGRGLVAIHPVKITWKQALSFIRRNYPRRM